MSRSTVDQNTQERILFAAERHPDGIPQSALQDALPDLSLEMLSNGINQLLRLCRLTVYKTLEDNQEGLKYKFVSKDDASKLRGLSMDDMLIYQLIREAKTQGVWSRDLKLRSNLQQAQVARILKILEQRTLIKAVRSVEGANRKVYMLYDLEPAREVTGGAWYTDRHLDSEFVGQAREICLQYISQMGNTTLDKIVEFIRLKNVFHVELTAEDIMSVRKWMKRDERVGFGRTREAAAIVGHRSCACCCSSRSISISPLVRFRTHFSPTGDQHAHIRREGGGSALWRSRDGRRGRGSIPASAAKHGAFGFWRRALWSLPGDSSVYSGRTSLPRNV